MKGNRNIMRQQIRNRQEQPDGSTIIPDLANLLTTEMHQHHRHIDGA
jgi:FPC/CPF motif-containing protein YcgG